MKYSNLAIVSFVSCVCSVKLCNVLMLRLI